MDIYEFLFLIRYDIILFILFMAVITVVLYFLIIYLIKILTKLFSSK